MLADKGTAGILQLLPQGSASRQALAKIPGNYRGLGFRGSGFGVSEFRV